MAFPTSREYTFFPGGPVKSAVLNKMQDAIIDLYEITEDLDDKVAIERKVPVGPSGMRPVVAADWTLPDDTGGEGSTGRIALERVLASGAYSEIEVDVPLLEGEKLKAYTVYIYEPNIVDANRTRAVWQRVLMATGVSGEFVDEPVTRLSVGGAPGMMAITEPGPITNGDEGEPPVAVAGQRIQLLIRSLYLGVQIYGVVFTVGAVP